MTLKTNRIALSAGLLLALSGTAFANRMEKVDMVREGIDLKPVIVKANANGYGGYENSAHRYFVRVFAKAKGSNRVWYAAIGNNGAAPFEVGGPIFFKQTAGRSEGWGVYKKSLSVDIGFSHTRWTTTPKAACEANLKKQMNKGMSKAEVLAKEWTVSTYSTIEFHAEADSKGNNKKNDHSTKSSEGTSKAIAYQVNVVCRKGN